MIELKTPAGIERMRHAGRITATALAAVRDAAVSRTPAGSSHTDADRHTCWACCDSPTRCAPRRTGCDSRA